MRLRGASERAKNPFTARPNGEFKKIKRRKKYDKNNLLNISCRTVQVLNDRHYNGCPLEEPIW